jgi:hypothetical protein
VAENNTFDKGSLEPMSPKNLDRLESNEKWNSTSGEQHKEKDRRRRSGREIGRAVARSRLGGVMLTAGLRRDGPLQALRNVFCDFLIACFSDSFTVVLDDFLLLSVNWKVFRF